MKINVISWIECIGWSADRTGSKAHLGRGRISKAKVERSGYGRCAECGGTGTVQAGDLAHRDCNCLNAGIRAVAG